MFPEVDMERGEENYLTLSRVEMGLMGEVQLVLILIQQEKD